LREEHDSEIVIDVSDMLWQLIGSALHVVMERGSIPGSLSEERLFVKVDGIILSGQIDLQEETTEGVVITDYKFTSEWAYRSEKPDWEQQLNVYRWLVETTKPKNVVALRVAALIRDFSRHNIGREGYPLAPIQMIDIPMWDTAKTEAFIRKRLEAHKNSKVDHAFGDALTECTTEERWESPTTYATKKKGRKTAIRVFSTIEEATELAGKEKDGYVETRLGEPKRCTGNYCGVRDFCSQWTDRVAVEAERERTRREEGAAEPDLS